MVGERPHAQRPGLGLPASLPPSSQDDRAHDGFARDQIDGARR
jgi:hypothetical protein